MLVVYNTRSNPEPLEFLVEVAVAAAAASIGLDHHVKPQHHRHQLDSAFLPLIDLLHDRFRT